MKELKEALGGLISRLFILITIILSKAFVLLVFWSWFITPFFKVPEISMTTSAGFIIIKVLLFGKANLDKKSNSVEESFEELGWHLGVLAVVLFVGWNITWFM
jgi:hypothetical protein